MDKKARSFPYDEGRKDGMPMEIGAKLRQARIAAGLTQEQTAEALGVSRQSISNWENERKELSGYCERGAAERPVRGQSGCIVKGGSTDVSYLDYLEESTTPCGAGGSNLC